MGKILIFVSIAISLLSAGLGLINKGKLAAAKSVLESTQATSNQDREKFSEAERNLQSTTEKLAAITSEKEQAIIQVTSLQDELDKSKGELTQIAAQRAEFVSQIEELTKDIEEKTQELDLLKSDKTSSENEFSNEQKALIQEKETLITKLQSDLDSARSRVATLQQEKQERLALKMRNGLEGRILAVNPAWNFVVINLGDKNGVLSNTELLVRRGTQLIGKVRITSVEPSTSIADIVAHSVPSGITIAPGDDVIYECSE